MFTLFKNKNYIVSNNIFQCENLTNVSQMEIQIRKFANVLSKNKNPNLQRIFYDKKFAM